MLFFCCCDFSQFRSQEISDLFWEWACYFKTLCADKLHKKLTLLFIPIPVTLTYLRVTVALKCKDECFPGMLFFSGQVQTLCVSD